MLKSNSTNEKASESALAQLTDFELTQKAADDIDAFEQIYWRHHRRMFGICLRMAKNFHEAEDVTQQTFVNLFKKMGSFRSDSAFTTWLHRVTVNQMLMHLRSCKLRREETTENGELPEINLKSPETPNNANQIINRLQLNEATAKLANDYRKMLILHDIEIYKHNEIARMLGCTAGTSKSQLHKARRVLRRLLTSRNASNCGMNKAVR